MTRSRRTPAASIAAHHATSWREIARVAARAMARRRIRAGVLRRSQRFARAQTGNVAIIFGLMIVPFISFGGLSIDFTNAAREKSRIQNALDASALAAGREFQVSGSVESAKNAASLYFEKQSGYQLKVNEVNEDSFVLTVGATEEVRTNFMSLLGARFETLTVDGLSKAQLEREIQGDHIEVSLMLDITGSMHGSRIADLKSAASDLVNILVEDGENESRIALAPFSHAVNVGSYYQAMTNQPPANGNTCVVERTGNKKYKDHKPNAANKFFKPFPASGSYWICPTAEVVPLTSDKQLLLTRINALPTHGNTAGHLGTAWAWYLISKRWATVFPGNRAPKPNLNGVKKIAVLMSDGQYNKKWFNNHNSDEQARRLCNQMKKAANGIEVYSVGFALQEGSAAYNRLKNCATDSAHFFAAADGTELRAAFRAIAFKIAALRLVE